MYIYNTTSARMLIHKHVLEGIFLYFSPRFNDISKNACINSS